MIGVSSIGVPAGTPAARWRDTNRCTHWPTPVITHVNTKNHSTGNRRTRPPPRVYRDPSVRDGRDCAPRTVVALEVGAEPLAPLGPFRAALLPQLGHLDDALVRQHPRHDQDEQDQPDEANDLGEHTVEEE